MLAGSVAMKAHGLQDGLCTYASHPGWLALSEHIEVQVSVNLGKATKHLDALERLPMLEASQWPCILVLSPGPKLIEARPHQSLDVGVF